jgi:hypothetical protein
VSPEAGEWSGFEIQTYRLIAGLLHELLNLIEKSSSVVEGEEMRRIMRKAPSAIRKQWSDIVGVATGQTEPHNKAFAQTLAVIRNNAVFHYHQQKLLVKGYREFFFDSEPTPVNEVAFASVGRDMEQTRFYFADAAMKTLLRSVSGEKMSEKGFIRRIGAAVESLNECLAHIVTHHISSARIG